ncbi:MAG: hypothetical protein JXO72_02485 [Vicinamibacteria bacterium]|nr:hypothetical protein [Vicinamibacteria bacterium]
MTDDLSSLEPGPVETIFDPGFVSELEELAATLRDLHAQPSVAVALPSKLAAFLAPNPGSTERQSLDEGRFVLLSEPQLHERLNLLIALCRQGGRREALEAIENFIVFFQAFVPTMQGEEGKNQVKRFFFRLVPTILHIAANDFGETDEQRAEGCAALRHLDEILTEISTIRLTPTESEVIFRNVDQLASFVAVGEYALANEIISSQLLGIISRNKLARGLYRIMEVEVNVQRYLKERLGYSTPQVTIPEDFERLAAYGPIRFLEEDEGGRIRRFIQIQIPDIPILRDVVLHLAPHSGKAGIDLRLDALGAVEVDLAPGGYGLGLVYQPDEA